MPVTNERFYFYLTAVILGCIAGVVACIAAGCEAGYYNRKTTDYMIRCGEEYCDPVTEECSRTSPPACRYIGLGLGDAGAGDAGDAQ